MTTKPKLTVRQIIAIRAKQKARTAVAGETAPVAAKVAKPKRPMSEKQALAWNTIILPKLQAGRAAKKAEREAAAAAEMPVAA